jgi:predicted dehydrogenase
MGVEADDFGVVMSTKWLLIGTGDIVRKRVAAALGNNLVGICGGKERAEALAKDHNIAEVYDDVDRALAHTRANAVYVATPVYRHRDEAIKAIQSGKHVLIEKPLGLSGDDAQAIADVAADAQVTAGCAYYRRCSPRYAHLKQLVDRGALGRIVAVRTSNWSWFNPATDDPKLWRVSRQYSGGGPLSDVGSHMFDLIVGLFGLPRGVMAKYDTLVQSYDVEDSAAAVMTLDNGALVSAQFGWNSKTWRHEFEVVGSEAKVLWYPADAGKVVVTRDRDIEELDLPSADNAHRPLVEDFEQAIAEGREPICPLGDAVKTNRILDAIYKSSDARQEVRP